MNDTLDQWQRTWGVSEAAMQDLRMRLAPQPSEEPGNGKSEAFSQSQIRLAAPRHQTILFRNNVGALMDARGVPVRYGLMNESKQMNERVKSGDLIGIERVQITPNHVGQFFGRFISVECKHPGWRPGEDKVREKAQQEWIALVRTWGGRAVFATAPSDVW